MESLYPTPDSLVLYGVPVICRMASGLRRPFAALTDEGVVLGRKH
jgi:hypothetical protein